MKWNSELDRVFKAEIKRGSYIQNVEQISVLLLTFAALILSDVVLALQIVQSEDVLHFSVGVDDRAITILLTGLNLLHEEMFDVVWLLVGQESGQILRTIGVSIKGL